MIVYFLGNTQSSVYGKRHDISNFQMAQKKYMKTASKQLIKQMDEMLTANKQVVILVKCT